MTKIISSSYYKYDPSKKVINIAIFGHANSGKSTTIGHLLRKLQCIDTNIYQQAENAIEQIGKNSLKYEFIMNTLKKERDKGISIQMKEAFFETSQHYFTVIKISLRM